MKNSESISYRIEHWSVFKHLNFSFFAWNIESYFLTR